MSENFLIFVVSSSTALSLVATYMAGALWVRTRHPAWLFVLLALLAAVSRRLLGLWNLESTLVVDTPDHLMGFGFASMICIGLTWAYLDDRRNRSRLLFWASDVVESTFAKLAIGLRILSILGGFTVGVVALDLSRRVLTGERRRDSVAVARMLAGHFPAHALHESSESLDDLLDLAQRTMTSLGYETRILLIHPDGRLIADRHALGLTEESDRSPHDFQGLVALVTTTGETREWSGRTEVPGSGLCEVALVNNPGSPLTIAVVTPTSLRQAFPYRAMLPWIAGMGAVILILSPGGVLLMYAAHKHSQKRVRVTLEELRATERSLRESESRMRLAVTDSHTTVFTQDTNLRYLWMFNTVDGREPSGVVGKTDHDFFSPEDANRLTALKRRTIETGKPLHSVEKVRFEGHTLWFDVMLEPVRDAKDRVTGLRGASTNITEIKQAEQSLRQSEQQYRRLAQRLELLLKELDHRVRNNIASLVALVERYARTARNVESFSHAMKGKLIAMKTVHDLMSASSWKRVGLRALLHTLANEILPEGYDTRRLVVEGEDLSLSARQAGPLAMVFQEFLTNATKHGAFTCGLCTVRVAWEVVRQMPDALRVRLVWRESLPCTDRRPDVSGGQGLKLVKQLAGFELGGDATYRIDQEGWSCELEMELDNTAGPVETYPDRS